MNLALRKTFDLRKQTSHACDWISVCGILIGCAIVLFPFSAAIAADENAALEYWIAMTLCPLETSLVSNTTSDDPNVGFQVPVSQELSMLFLGPAAEGLEHLYRGAKMTRCDWGTNPRKHGPVDRFVHAEKAHGLGRIAMLRARFRFEQGEWKSGIDDVIATMILGRYIGSDKMEVNVRFGCMLETMTTGTAAAYLPRMPREARESLARSLNRLPAPTSMREVAIHQANAIDWVIERVEHLDDEAQLHELLTTLASEDAPHLLNFAGSRQGVIRLAEDCRVLLQLAADSMSLPPKEYDRAYQTKIKPLLADNPLAPFLGCDFESARNEESTARCRLEFLKTAIDVLNLGPAALADHPDPYGTGPFGYEPFDGGFKLRSELVFGDFVSMEIGLRKVDRPAAPRPTALD